MPSKRTRVPSGQDIPEASSRQTLDQPRRSDRSKVAIVYQEDEEEEEEIVSTRPKSRKRRRNIEQSDMYNERDEQQSNRPKRPKIEDQIPVQGAFRREREPRRKPDSKLSIRISQLGVEAGGNNSAKGEIKYEDGSMFYKDTEQPNWTAAAYHEQYRKIFIDEDGRRGRFRNHPLKGLADGDETSFEPGQENWGPESKDWANIVDNQGIEVMSQFERPGKPKGQNKPGPMVHNGLVMLDMDNHPVRNIPGLNRVFSTELENWRIEALRRLFPATVVQDFRGRMPAKRLVASGLIRDVQSLSALTNRAARFRKEELMIAWNARRGSEKNRRQIERAKAVSAGTQGTDSGSGRSPSEPDPIIEEDLPAGSPVNNAQIEGQSFWQDESRNDVFERESEHVPRAESFNNLMPIEVDSEEDAENGMTEVLPNQFLDLLDEGVENDSTEMGPDQLLENSDEESRADDFESDQFLQPPEWYNQPFGGNFDMGYNYVPLAPEINFHQQIPTQSSEIGRGHMVPLFGDLEDQRRAEWNSFDSPMAVLNSRRKYQNLALNVQVFWAPPETARLMDKYGRRHPNVLGDKQLAQQLGYERVDV